MMKNLGTRTRVLVGRCLCALLLASTGCEDLPAATAQNLGWGMKGMLAGVSDVLFSWALGAVVNGLSFGVQ